MRSIRAHHLGRLDRVLKSLTQRSDRLSGFRLVSFVLAVVVFTAGALGTARGLMYFLGTALSILFIFQLFSHRRLDQTLQFFKGRRATLVRQLATRTLDWSKISVPPHPALTDSNIPPSLSDLDIVGKHSLLSLIDYTVSSEGYSRLISLFCMNRVSDEEVLRRQRLVSELRALKVFRHGFVARLSLFPETIERHRLLALLDKPLTETKQSYVSVMSVLFILQGAMVVSFIHYFMTGGAPYFLIPLIALLATHWYARKKILTSEAYQVAVGIVLFMEKFAAAAKLLEKHAGTRKSELHEVLSPFRGTASASHALRRLDWISGALGVRQNFIAHALVHAVFPWDPFFTLKLQRLQTTIREQLPLWSSALAEVEAFLSLANYSEANEQFTLPVLVRANDQDSSFLSAQNLKHPLLPADRVVGNGLVLTHGERCALITGSNMSGKSTFLRAVGVNLLLAKAGAPVSATELRFRNAPLYTSLRVADSLDEGLSSFYAETKRLASVLEAARSEPPVIFLIDEIFRGTNNRERLIGSRAYVREITSTGNYGLVTTHDLELCSLEQPGSGIANYHFKEDFKNGVMSFSYQKQRGPCPTTNALEVMRLSGLPIE